MKRKFTDMEKIEKYLDNQVDEQERAEVNSRLVDDEEFRKLFDQMEYMLEGIRHTGSKTTVEEKLRNLEATIHLLEEEEEEPDMKDEKNPIIVVWYNRPIIRAIAASVVLLVVALYTVGPFGKVSDERLFDEHFVHYPNVQGVTRSSDVAEMNNRQKAYAAYDMRDYEAAIPIFVEVIKGSDNLITDKFYLANAYLASGNGSEAAKLLVEIVDKRVGLASSAKWYLALSYLQSGERELARNEFREIAEGESDYADEADKILRRMQK